MQDSKTQIKEHLIDRGYAPRETEQGLRMNLKELNQVDINELAWLPTDPNTLIKRSGTGLVVIINC